MCSQFIFHCLQVEGNSSTCNSIALSTQGCMQTINSLTCRTANTPALGRGCLAHEATSPAANTSGGPPSDCKQSVIARKPCGSVRERCEREKGETCLCVRNVRREKGETCAFLGFANSILKCAVKEQASKQRNTLKLHYSAFDKHKKPHQWAGLSASAKMLQRLACTTGTHRTGAVCEFPRPVALLPWISAVDSARCARPCGVRGPVCEAVGG